MTRHSFPSDRLAYSIGLGGGPFLSAARHVVRLWLDTEGTQPASVLLDGAETSTLTVGLDSLLPRFLGPDEAVVLYVGQPGATYPLWPEVQPFLDALDARVTLAQASGARYRTYDFPTPSASWPITHGLGRIPSVTVLDASGAAVLCDIEHGSPNALSITHAAPLAGSVHLNG